MGIKWNNLSLYQQSLVDPKSAAQLGLSTPAQTLQDAPGGVLSVGEGKDRREVVEQRNFAVECKKRGWRFIWHRTDKRSTANRGCPDFAVAAKGTTFWIEFKRPGGELRPDQAAFKLELAANGIEMHVVHSALEAVDLISGAQQSADRRTHREAGK